MTNAQSVNKPSHLNRYDLIAIMNIGEEALIKESLGQTTYDKSEIAVNMANRKVQVYVNSATKRGINNFLKAYPNAEVRKDDTLDNPEEWRLLAFPDQLINSNSALDSYYLARHAELDSLNEKETIKSERIRK